VSAPALAQDVSVNVHLNTQHSVAGVAEFDRSAYIVMHSSLTENEWDSNAQRDQFLDEYDVYLGRNNGTLPWELSQTRQDQARTGWPDMAHIASRGQSSRNGYANRSAVHKHEHRLQSGMIGGQSPMYPNGQTHGGNWSLQDYEAMGEFMAQHLKHHYGAGGQSGEPRPMMLEVMNEPFVKAWQLGTTNANLSDMHNVVAERVRAVNPDVMVGGYSSAWPEFDANGFTHWRENWKLFIDRAGANMDFFAVHIYDNPAEEANRPQRNRRGSNAEAILDIIEHYSMLTLGEVKPFNISEYGYFERDLDGTPYTRQRDWLNLRTFSSMMMQFMERPDRVIKAIPFMILKANWWSHSSGERYPYRLLRQQNELAGETGTQWVYTDFVKFYQLWSDVNGTRLETDASDPDVQVDAYVDGRRVYVILNNLDYEPVDVNLDMIDAMGTTLEEVYVKHLFADASGIPTLDEYEAAEVSSFTLDAEATAVLEYTFASDISIEQDYAERSYYADTYLEAIRGRRTTTFMFDGVALGAEGEAVLRLGISRFHGTTRIPTAVTVNGTEIALPSDWKGDDQTERIGFYGVIEFPVPLALLQERNEVEVQFDRAGGTIASAVLRVYERGALGATNTDAEQPSKGFGLAPNYPNPFGESTEIQYTLSEPAAATLCVYNLMGQRVATLAEGPHTPAVHTIRWDGRTDDGALVSNGVYVVQLRVKDQMQTRKLVVVR